MTPSLREIQMFVAAYEERTFTAAAAREHATQSGVSQHIRKLEERFGVRLFTRTGASVVPTPAGDAYYRKCLEVLRASDAATQALRPFGGALDGTVMAGLMPTMTRCTLAPALQRFLGIHPNVSVHVVEAYSAVLIEQVRAGVLEFAVVPAFAESTGLRQRIFARTREVLVSRVTRDRTHRAPVRLAGLGRLKLVLPRPQNARRKTIETYVTSTGVHVERVIELDAMMGTLDFVATSDWVTVLPGLMMASDVEPTSFMVNPLDEPPLWLDLVLIESSHRTLSPAAKAFCDVLAEEAHRLNRWAAPDEAPSLTLRPEKAPA